MVLKADISKTGPGRYLFLFIFMCGNSKCTRMQKIKNFSGEVNWVHQALKGKFSKIFNILLLRNRKEDVAETWHTCIGHCPLQKLCLLFRSDKNSGCYGNL